MFTQYAEIHVPEYWLVDPEAQTITILRLEAEHYIEYGLFHRSDVIHSFTLGELPLIANQVLQAGQ